MRRLVLPIAIAAAASLALVVALVARPRDGALAFDVWLLFIGVLALAALLRAAFAPMPRETDSVLDRRRRPRPVMPQLPELAKLEREVDLAGQTAFDLHYRLRPTLQRIAAARLARRGVDLETAGSSAELLLGPAWELVRPDRPRPERHDAPGASRAQIRAVVDALEDV